MRFKYYLSTKDISKAVNFYTKVFNATIEKQGGHHAKLNFYNKITFLVYGTPSSQSRKDGYLVMRFEKDEKNLYYETKKRVLEAGCHFGIEDFAARWGTTFSEFTDPFGYTWDLEIDTE